MYSAEGTESAPAIVLDFNTGQFSITGKSIPENPWDVYQPVLDKIAEYRQQPAPNTVLVIEMEFFNTSTSKMILDIISELEKIHLEELSQVVIEWRYHDEDMMEVGEDFKFLLSVPFELIEIS